MNADPARKVATYQDVLDAPEHVVAEVLAGELYTSPRPAKPHSEAFGNLFTEVHRPFHRARGGPGGWLILPEPELHLGPDILVPDLAGWRRERMPRLDREAAFELAPDWVCEILSPSTARHDRVRKLPIYAREAVRWVWLVDPDARTLEVFQLENGRWSLLSVHEDQDLVRAVPFDAIELELGLLWADVEPLPEPRR